ncbi:MAG: hypothetical protein JKY13_03615 [Gammaproteobacteria bacterium]|nr:hypothetical protein [Gammaproteobacteria bacterium]
MLNIPVKYTNLEFRKAVLAKTHRDYTHLMMSSVIKLAKTAVMATPR